jgi:hypothetical protein
VLGASAVVTGTLGLAGCGAGTGIHLAAPKPTGAVATSCAALITALPDDVVIGGHRRGTDPASPYTAAFGDPAVTVRCGVGNVKYDPTSNVVAVNGVDWLTLTDNDHERRYLSYQTPFRVEVTIPAKYLPANVLPPISALLAPGRPAG